jgi:hypothetical protein
MPDRIGMQKALPHHRPRSRAYNGKSSEVRDISVRLTNKTLLSAVRCSRVLDSRHSSPGCQYRLAGYGVESQLMFKDPRSKIPCVKVSTMPAVSTLVRQRFYVEKCYGYLLLSSHNPLSQIIVTLSNMKSNVTCSLIASCRRLP